MPHSRSFVLRSLRLIWAASGRWTASWVLMSIAIGLLPGAMVYLTKWLVDALASTLGKGTTSEQIAAVTLPVSLMLGAILAQRILGGLNEWVNSVQIQLVQDHIKGLIHAKASNVDYGFFETPEYFDQFHQANTQASSRTLNLLRNLSNLGQSAITFGSIALILLQYSVWIPLILIASSVPAFVLLLRHNRQYHQWWKDVTSDRRWANYLDGVLTSQQSAAEIRLNDLGDFFSNHHRQVRERMRNAEIRFTRRRVVARIFAGIIGSSLAGLILAWIVWRAMQGQATLGDLALFYQSFKQGQMLAGTLLSSMGEIHTNALFLEQVYEYLDQENAVRDPSDPVPFPARLQQGIEFENVTFAYPGNERPSIDHFRLQVPAGKVVAIVGVNGSGKSTLIKLLCRFYDPLEGRVLVDGRDLREFAQSDLRRQIAVMFQFPMRYHLTVAENIQVGDLHGDHRRERLVEAARGAGAHEFIERLPQQYDNRLGRSFSDAAELSGGEWQRVALARAFLRQAEIVVLDEPTSFMDSWAENEWLERFRQLVQGRTAIIITHRFTTAMQADIIHVMERGKIIESGSHTDLLQLDGKYASSWREQVRLSRDLGERDATLGTLSTRRS